MCASPARDYSYDREVVHDVVLTGLVRDFARSHMPVPVSTAGQRVLVFKRVWLSIDMCPPASGSDVYSPVTEIKEEYLHKWKRARVLIAVRLPLDSASGYARSPCIPSVSVTHQPAMSQGRRVPRTEARPAVLVQDCARERRERVPGAAAGGAQGGL